MEIRYLKGVGEKRAALLEKLGIHSVEDLLEFYPRDYVDYSKPYPVASAPFDSRRSGFSVPNSRPGARSNF